MIDRRKFVATGLSSLGSLGAITSGMVLPGGLRAEAANLPYLMVVYASGGWDPTMVFDNQLNSTYVTGEPGARAATTTSGLTYVDHADRPAVKSFFDAYGDNAAIVNGISTGSMELGGALRNMLGFVPAGKFRPVDWLSYFVGALNPVLDMPHAVLDAPFMPGDYASVAVRLGKTTVRDHLATPNTAEALGTAGEKALRAFRASVYSTFQNDVNPLSLDGEKMRGLFYGYAREPLVAARVKATATALGDQGEDSDLLFNGKTAVELFATGASQCATVQAGPTNLWDTRTDHFAKQTTNYEALFNDLSAIFAYAETRGILQRMLVVVMSERGRAPRLNDQDGKGPWAYTSSLLWGMGIKGGKVITASDASLRGIPINPLFGAPGVGTTVTLTMAHVFAAIYLLFNAPYQLVLPDIQPLTPILQRAA